MANDALDPGPDGTYPYLPRNPDGSIDTVRMPMGVVEEHKLRRRNVFGEEAAKLDLTPEQLRKLPSAESK